MKKMEIHWERGILSPSYATNPSIQLNTRHGTYPELHNLCYSLRRTLRVACAYETQTGNQEKRVPRAYIVSQLLQNVTAQEVFVVSQSCQNFISQFCCGHSSTDRGSVPRASQGILMYQFNLKKPKIGDPASNRGECLLLPLPAWTVEA